MPESTGPPTPEGGADFLGPPALVAFGGFVGFAAVSAPGFALLLAGAGLVCAPALPGAFRLFAGLLAAFLLASSTAGLSGTEGRRCAT